MRFRLSRRRAWTLLGVVGLALAAYGASVWFFTGPAVAEAVELRGYVHGRPPVPVVFTSRTEPASLVAAAPEGEGFTYPGTIPWTAREGRLRLLTPEGKVYELTWGRQLPDGGTLIDVMSPCVTIDGKRILFAGRRAPPDAGRWRIYEVGADGRGLKQVTGGPDDTGCDFLPPMRFSGDGAPLAPDARKRLDYDDVDPGDLGGGKMVFVSSRLPDLGRDHARRATQLWVRSPDEPAPRPLTANRNNDRWPSVMTNQAVLFSLWSRNREVVTGDGREIAPWTPNGSYLTAPTDYWMGARILPNGDLFGYAVKMPEPVWRPRQLFNGNLVFMSDAGAGRLRLGQASSGYLRHSPSSLRAGTELPTQRATGLEWGPERDSEGRPLSAATPAPCPDEAVLFAGAPADPGAPVVPARYGIYTVGQNWSGGPVPTLLFDDPALVDAEPVAVYQRDVAPTPPVTKFSEPKYGPFKLADGRTYDGPAGFIDNPFVPDSIAATMPSQMTDAGDAPLFPPPKGVKSVVIYAAHRDRFDDPVRPRVPGAWEKLMVIPVESQGANNGVVRAWLPSNPMAPTVLAGFDGEGKVFKWESVARDSRGRTAIYYAVAGDHYSGTRHRAYNFCLGCHTGHTFQYRTDEYEKVKK